MLTQHGTYSHLYNCMPASYGHLPIKLLFQIMEGRLTNGNASLNELFHFPVIKKEFSQNWAEMEDSKVKQHFTYNSIHD